MRANAKAVSAWAAAAVVTMYTPACGEGDGTNLNSGSTGGVLGGYSAVEAFLVPERPWDLALDPDGLVYASGQAGGTLYSWDPTTEERTQISDDLKGIQGIAFSGEALYLTTTDLGVTGTLSLLDGRNATTLATQADDGTLFRQPVDLAPTPDGGWVLADLTAPGIFVVSESGAISFHDIGSEAPMSVAFYENDLYVGGDDGTWNVGWPVTTSTLVDSRSSLGLAVVDGDLWGANSEDLVFVVGGPQVGISGPARAASMTVDTSGVSVYVADHVGQNVWFLAADEEDGR